MKAGRDFPKVQRTALRCYGLLSFKKSARRQSEETKLQTASGWPSCNCPPPQWPLAGAGRRLQHPVDISAKLQ